MAWLWPALALLAVLLASAALALWYSGRHRDRHHITRLREELALLETRLATVQEQSRLELLTMGQRLIGLEKQLLRMADRLEALEAQRAPAERYGQLDARLGNRRRGDDTPPPSQAEAALRSMLQQRGTSTPGDS